MLLEKIYADALAGYAGEKGLVTELQNEFRTFMEIYENNPILREILDDPSISSNKKLIVIRKIMKEGFRKDFESFISIIITKQRQKILPEVYLEFMILTNKMAGAMDIEIRSAFPLTDKTVEEIRVKFAKMRGNPNAYAHVSIVPALIGGFEVRIGDVFDHRIMEENE